MASEQTSLLSQRPSWDDTFMEMTRVLARRSTCARVKTAALLVKENRIISVGYNGVPSETEHCLDHWQNRFEQNCKKDCVPPTSHLWSQYLASECFLQDHHEWSKNCELHAEQNAIVHAAKTGICTNNSVLFTLLSPCIFCAKVILAAGVREVRYSQEYSRDLHGLQYLADHGVTVIRVSSF